VLFNNLEGIERYVVDGIDNQVKGYADIKDMLEGVASQMQEPYLSLFTNYLRTCENRDKYAVYYSPLLGPVPPFFKYVKRFDSFSVIEKFAKELQSIDTHSTGYIPVNLFRSILEHELKIKEKIVLDFINALRETDHQANLQSLDVNLSSNSLRAHIDYVTLLHKLTYYFQKIKVSGEVLQNHGHLLDASSPDVVTLSVDIQRAIRLRHPLSDLDVPNAFVVLNLPYGDSNPRVIRTSVVPRNSYPVW
jgi:hypothetical protein